MALKRSRKEGASSSKARPLSPPDPEFLEDVPIPSGLPPWAHDKYKQLWAKIIIPTRYLDMQVVSDLGLTSKVDELINGIGWQSFFRVKEETYPELPIK